MSNQEYDSRAVANAILRYAKDKGIPLTLMQVIKLVYLAHGWSYALHGHPLIKHPVQAWQYGPVVPQVYQAFKGSGSLPITTLARDPATGAEFWADFDDEDLSLIHAVVDAYGRMHAFKLSDIMHDPGTPWTETSNSKGSYAEIDEALISDHFRKLKEERRVQ